MIAQLTPKPSADLGKLQDKIEWLIFSGVRDREAIFDILLKQRWSVGDISDAIAELLIGRRIYPKPIGSNTYYLQAKVANAIKAKEGRRKVAPAPHPLALWAAEQTSKEIAAKCEAEDSRQLRRVAFHMLNIKHYQWLTQTLIDSPHLFSILEPNPIESLQQHNTNAAGALATMRDISADYSQKRLEAQASGDWKTAGQLGARSTRYRQRMEAVRTRLDRVRYILSLH